MISRVPLAGLLLAGLLLTGCGDPLVGETYRGEPIGALPLEVSSADDPSNYDGVPVRVALFWSPGGPDSAQSTWVEQVQTSRLAQPLDRFDLMVFEQPTPDLLVAGTGYGLARALAYQDDDGDGLKGADEPIVGINGRSALIYAPQATTGPSGNPLPAGFHIVTAPVPCAPQPVPPGVADPDDCGVPLGQACRMQMPNVDGSGMEGEGTTADESCGAGTCLGSGQGGYCALAVSAGASCVPAGGRVAVVEGQMGPNPYYLKACDSDGDCRVGEGYLCDHWRGVCLAAERLSVVLGETELDRLCMPAMTGMGPSGGQGSMLPP